MNAPTETWTLIQWKDWARDYTDMYFGTVQIDARMLLAIIADRESAHDQIEQIQKAWDEER
jgi:hypothetical protein